MNRKEISEIRRRFNMEKNAISCIRGCYVNEKREIVSMFNRPLMNFPQEEAEKYLAIFRRTLSGIPGKNLVNMTFRPDQVMEGEEHRLLSALRNTALKVEEGVQTFYQRVIESLEMEGNYLILMLHDAYDVPFQTKDDLKVDDASEEVFDYIMCAICPVKLTKPALSYFPEDNDFHTRDLDWVVAAPELGFMFPTFDDRAANIYNALYFTRDTETMHREFIDGVFNTDSPMPADEQKETFQMLLEDTLGDELSLEVVQTVHEQIRDMIEEQKSDKEAEPLVVSKREVSNMLQSCGVSEEHVAAFEQKYDEDFGATIDLGAHNIVNEKKFEVRTPDVVIQVNPERSDLVETRVIDGFRYILIRADEGVAVNGVNINIASAEAAPSDDSAPW
ncbi:MAG: DUF4317 domain-containing protein [Clostridia bacterium]|nr:DUF4317 domain-containing protein [Clostridia bacterium]